jgi:Chaperone of endosialidase
MRSIRNSISTIVFTIILASTAFAQNETAPAAAATAASTNAPAVLVSTTAENLRFTSPEQAAQMRLEVYAAGGQQIFDSGMQNGNILDWKLSEARLVITEGSYLCVVTVKDLRGRASQRFGTISVQAGQVSVSRAREDELTPAQKQALAASRQSQKITAPGTDTALTIVRENKERALTLVGHDGQNGQVTSTSGALTLRTGDSLTNQSKEQVRITPEGRVGIGTDNPEATLDVAGTIRARGGIVFDDGTVLKTAPGTTTRVSSSVATVNSGTATFGGSGTQGALAKWADNAGTLGDSVITEAGGNVGIGTATPNSKLHVVGRLELGNAAGGPGTNPTLVNPNNVAGLSQFQFYPSGTTDSNMSFSVVPRGLGANLNRAQFSIFNTDFLADSTNYEFASLRARGPDFIFGTGSSGTGQNRPIMFASGFLRDNATNDGQLFLATDGRVGIGHKSPQSKLDVAGDLRISGVGNGLIFADGTKLTTANSTAMSGTSIVAAINDAATTGVIADNRHSPNLARLNGQNAWTGQNTFVNGLSANGVAITNVGNPVSATDATNKAYTDANFVRFVPGAEQLSVGDANGTAPMINLRGGSTCCSGPGGHTPAWFKVFQNGSFVATGNLGIGVSPMQGKGYRTSWDSYKGAFRSGYADNEWDDANVGFFSWAGGSNSTAIGLYALAFGDTNSAESTSSIVFGSGNQVKGAAGFAAGAGNRVCDTYGVALGNNAKSGGPLINGKCDPDTFNIRGLAAVAIGYNVTADQDHTTAMGKFASNNGFTGTFIWSDGSAQQSADTFRNTANNEFAARATGGFRFRTNLAGTTGCNLPQGSGVFNCTSSRTTKENFLFVKGEDVLAKLRNIPVSTWNYISEGQQVRHMGPMAEDFYKAFALGTGNTSIGVQDLAGVSLAAVKALEERTVQLQQKIAEVEQLRNQLSTLEQRFAALEKLVQASGSGR